MGIIAHSCQRSGGRRRSGVKVGLDPNIGEGVCVADGKGVSLIFVNGIPVEPAEGKSEGLMVGAKVTVGLTQAVSNPRM